MVSHFHEQYALLFAIALTVDNNNNNNNNNYYYIIINYYYYYYYYVHVDREIHVGEGVD